MWPSTHLSSIFQGSLWVDKQSLDVSVCGFELLVLGIVRMLKDVLGKLQQNLRHRKMSSSDTKRV